MPDALNRELDCYRYRHKIKFYVSKLRISFHLMRKIAIFVIRQVLVGSKIHICRRSLLSSHSDSHSDSHCPSNYPSHSVLQLTTNRIPLTRLGLNRKENSRQGNQTLSSRDGSCDWVAYFPFNETLRSQLEDFLAGSKWKVYPQDELKIKFSNTSFGSA